MTGRHRSSWRALLLVAAAFVLGWAASIAWSSAAPLRLAGEIRGTVSVVNATGSQFCLDPLDGGRRRCGVTYQRMDDPPLAVGDVVSVAVGVLRHEDGEREIFVVEAVE
jgi:hypothetical protein